MNWQWDLIVENCTGCGICFDVCPEKAIEMDKDMAYPIPVENACLGCMECVKECPFDAIDVKEIILNRQDGILV